MKSKKERAIEVALADDHILLRNALANLIDTFENCKVIYQANNGKELIDLVKTNRPPDILLLDVSMPTMDGYDTAAWFNKHCPSTIVLILTMYNSENLLIRLLNAGVRGFLRKDIHPTDLKNAIASVVNSGFYCSYETSGTLANLIRHSDRNNSVIKQVTFSDREVVFIKLVCTEMTYKEIAMSMKLTPRGVDKLRDHLFEKCQVKSRIGLALVAFKQGMVSI